VKVQALLLYEERITLELDLPDDGYSEGDILDAAASAEPFKEFVAVVDVVEL
jgi:hypothetical protein